eukprot:8354983-Pyramimonas_sp.AAC.1
MKRIQSRADKVEGETLLTTHQSRGETRAYRLEAQRSEEGVSEERNSERLKGRVRAFEKERTARVRARFEMERTARVRARFEKERTARARARFEKERTARVRA